MLSFLLGFLPGLVTPVMNYLTTVKDTQVKLFQARTGSARDVAVAAIAAQAQVQNKWWFAALPPACIGMCYAGWVAKATLWDKVIGSFAGCAGVPASDSFCTRWFQTDGLGGDLHWAFTLVIISYFGVAYADKFLNTR